MSKFKLGQTVYGTEGLILFDYPIERIVKVEVTTAAGVEQKTLYGNYVATAFENLRHEEDLFATPEDAAAAWQKDNANRAERMLQSYRNTQTLKEN